MSRKVVDVTEECEARIATLADKLDKCYARWREEHERYLEACRLIDEKIYSHVKVEDWEKNPKLASELKDGHVKGVLRKMTRVLVNYATDQFSESSVRLNIDFDECFHMVYPGDAVYLGYKVDYKDEAPCTFAQVWDYIKSKYSGDAGRLHTLRESAKEIAHAFCPTNLWNVKGFDHWKSVSKRTKKYTCLRISVYRDGKWYTRDCVERVWSLIGRHLRVFERDYLDRGVDEWDMDHGVAAAQFPTTSEEIALVIKFPHKIQSRNVQIVCRSSVVEFQVPHDFAERIGKFVDEFYFKAENESPRSST